MADVDALDKAPFRCPHPACKGAGREYAIKSLLKYVSPDVNLALVLDAKANSLFRRKHYKIHVKDTYCDFPTCPRGRPGSGFASPKDMHKHAWVAHPKHAAKKDFPNPRSMCELCGAVLRRKDNLIRHKTTSCPSRPH